MTLNRRGVAVLAAAALAALTLSGVEPASAAAPASSLIVNPKVVGSGYRTIAYAGSTGLGEPTLAYCGKTLPSDKARSSRFQVDFQRGGPTFASKTFVSEEAVAYKTGKGTQVRADLAKLPKLCPHGVTVTLKGGTARYTETKTHLAGAPAGATVFTGHTSYSKPGTPGDSFSEFDIFMSRGDNLVGVYFSTDKASVTAGIKVAKAAAALLAKT